MSAREWIVLGVMSFTILLISLDQTVLNVALPTLVKDLHPSNSGLQWIADSYTLTNAVLLLPGGALGDRYGRRLMFVVGAAIFGGGSLGCALVHTTGSLIAMRAITGVGAACLMPATLSILVATFVGHRRAQAIGIWAGVGGIGASAGPLLGGYLLQHFWWGSVFLINVPIAVVAIAGAFYGVTEGKSATPAALDPVGVLLSAGGFGALTYALIVAPSKHWGSSTVIGVLVASVVLLSVFLWWDGRRADPLFDLELFRNPMFSAGLGAVTALFFAMFGVSFLISQYIQFVQGADVLSVGLRFLPLALGSLVASNLAPRLARHFGLRPVLMTGMGGIAAGLGIFATLGVTSTYLPVGIAFAFIGSGMGLSIAPASNAVVSALPAAKVGAGSGLRSMVQFLGGSFGVAIIGSLANSRYRSRMDSAFQGPLSGVPQSARPTVSEQVGQAIIAAKKLPSGVAQKVVTVADRSFVSGMHLSALVALVIVVLSAIAVGAYIPTHLPELDSDLSEEDLAHIQAAAAH
jgi:MFS transporter, DHA2 family, multidrug resistance protein